VVNPVLRASLPLKKRAMPSLPVVIVVEPDTMMSHLVASPGADALPAFSVIAVGVVTVVVMACVRLISPVPVSTRMSPLE
jgi:hypothetical protein